MADISDLIPALQAAGYSPQQIQNLIAVATASGQLTGAASQEDARRWDATFGQNQASQAADIKVKLGQLDNQRRQIAIQQGEAKANAWYQQQEAQLARDTFEESKTQYGLNTAVKLGELGLQARGPDSYQQAVNLRRGIADVPQFSGYIQSLLTNSKLAPFTAEAGQPTPVSLDSILSSFTGTANAGTTPTATATPTLTGAASVLGRGTPVASLTGGTGTAASGAAYDAAVAPNNLAAAKVIYQNGHKLLPGTLEALDPTEQKLLKDDIETGGGNWSSFLSQYYGSKPGQGFADQGLA
jgi:hypothetical protein